MVPLFTSILASEYGVTLSRTIKISHKARAILECGRQLQSAQHTEACTTACAAHTTDVTLMQAATCNIIHKFYRTKKQADFSVLSINIFAI